MSRFTDALKIIPNTARYIAAFFYVLFVTLALTVFIPGDKELRYWPVAGKIAFAFVAFLFVVGWILLIGYVYADAKRRGMRYVMWTFLAALIPNAIGVILYFILRDPLPQPCPNCARLVNSKFVFCPYCGSAMKPTCPNCGRAIERAWSNCPECGTKLPAVTAPPQVA
jgi:RNA polymerase subunit RPABC4/transcription elongation factor Spt4